ncbi:MAG: hypothetical protein A3A96_01175 [Candidatus Zambryskibacteria bacterium RIFCSPLOWO2_01_FULL_39_39]|uniref:Transcriptional repressor PaaX-like central Cas2-like domain-containing protein n=1 Tax=Candidatus Zambryskibacteria bacterium RIFCSPLOWO2_01_FULL_39_39 TaxID=1802758 RepID=A0A1G2TYU2_9BACT|nr:MAG: Transcriptional regulator, PaaX family [Parcubacteria group bacterium GW2011_GWA1_38_7]OHA87518.1 MAG: hypothetical protein A2644_04205 [Candidatus Zambryskibacteria bacterium RIFCSPHIGHO2_01_FULL_39_63]OHA95046.1 MAG: hypothetical protein A3B88_03115 [Candidatus Zambryskibacteria bacterium RIFCSPHIGHO2_02_FULL_39_19]OHA98166.1 MAG: hypothetical protein A3F20_03925 [Candidatus Zambryskibacteria bacterium RIFCSPHIGHO2_12_FULL_39_21]OHB02468.1 MAG: hypothetical protein A3A96_01175 [Candid
MSLEKEAKIQRRRYLFHQAILTTLKVSGFITLAVCAPNALGILKTCGWIGTKKNPIYNLMGTVQKLEDKGFIEIKKNRDGEHLKITNKGKLFLWKLESKHLVIKKPKKWDKRWRLIVFDIKEQDRFQRDATRVMLQNIGCVRLQNSVWAFPYDCEEVVTLLKAHYEIGEEVLYIIAEKIENDSWLKKHFKLI